jgi:hypothetical protein
MSSCEVWYLCKPKYDMAMKYIVVSTIAIWLKLNIGLKVLLLTALLTAQLTLRGQSLVIHTEYSFHLILKYGFLHTAHSIFFALY